MKKGLSGPPLICPYQQIKSRGDPTFFLSPQWTNPRKRWAARTPAQLATELVLGPPGWPNQPNRLVTFTSNKQYGQSPFSFLKKKKQAAAATATTFTSNTNEPPLHLMPCSATVSNIIIPKHLPNQKMYWKKKWWQRTMITNIYSLPSSSVIATGLQLWKCINTCTYAWNKPYHALITKGYRRGTKQAHAPEKVYLEIWWEMKAGNTATALCF
jgi:hypothetical protein